MTPRQMEPPLPPEEAVRARPPVASATQGARARELPTWLRPGFGLAVFLLAVALRLIPVLAAPNLGIGLDDMFQYDMLGRSLAAGNGFRWYAPPDRQSLLNALQDYGGLDLSQLSGATDPRGVETSFRAPLYPAFLAVVYWLYGLTGRFFAVRLIQAIILALLAPLTLHLARAFGGARTPSRLAAAAVAIWPMLVVFPMALATENLFLPLATAGLLAAALAYRSRRMGAFALAGVVFGLAILTRSVIVGLPVLLSALFWRGGQRRGAILLSGAALLLVTPWAVRNTLLHHQPTFVETSLGYNLYLGYYPGNDGTFRFGPSLDLVTVLDDAQRDQLGRAEAWSFVVQDPARVPVLMVDKLGHLWGLEQRAFTFFYSHGLMGQRPPWQVVLILLVLVLPLVIVFPLGIVGWATSPRDFLWWMASLTLGYYIGIHMLIMAEERFHLVLLPLVLALAARGLSGWPSFRAAVRRREPWALRAAVLALVLVGLAFFNWGSEIFQNADQLATLIGPHGASAYFNY